MSQTLPTFELMRNHRSIRKYTEDPVTDEDVAEAVSAAQLASSSNNVQAYSLIRVRNRDTLAELAALAGGQDKITFAGAFFVICADARRHKLIAKRAGGTYRSGLEEFLVAVIDASLFAQNLSLAFEAQGYGICYLGALRNDLARVDRLLELPEGVMPVFGLCVGRPAQDPPIRPRLPLSAVLMEERYLPDEEMLAMVDKYDEETRAYFQERSGEGRDWSGPIAERYAEPKRRDLAAYYAGKGANLG